MDQFGIIAAIAGLIIEILGAFLLAAEAIGLQRLRSWISTLQQLSEDAEDPADSAKPWKTPGQALNFLVTLAATLAGTTAAILVFKVESLSGWWVFAVALGTGLFCGLLAVLAASGMIKLIDATAASLQIVEKKTSMRAAGVLGFLLLLLGFVLQLAGNIILLIAAN